MLLSHTAQDGRQVSRIFLTKEFTCDPTVPVTLQPQAGHFKTAFAPKQATAAYTLHLRAHSNIKPPHSAVKHTIQNTQTHKNRCRRGQRLALQENRLTAETNRFFYAFIHLKFNQTWEILLKGEYINNSSKHKCKPKISFNSHSISDSLRCLNSHCFWSNSNSPANRHLVT